MVWATSNLGWAGYVVQLLIVRLVSWLLTSSK